MSGKKKPGLSTNKRAYECVCFTVTYNGNNETSGVVPIDESSYIIGNTVTVLGNLGVLVKSDYAFAGWNTLADGSGTNYDVGDTFIIDANITLYAQWYPVYTVTYNGNNETSGVVPIDSLAYLGGSAVTVLENSGSLENIGYTFAGWDTLADGSGTNYDVSNTFIINANEFLYAKWIISGLDLII